MTQHMVTRSGPYCQKAKVQHTLNKSQSRVQHTLNKSQKAEVQHTLNKCLACLPACLPLWSPGIGLPQVPYNVNSSH